MILTQTNIQHIYLGHCNKKKLELLQLVWLRCFQMVNYLSKKQIMGGLYSLMLMGVLNGVFIIEQMMEDYILWAGLDYFTKARMLKRFLNF